MTQRGYTYTDNAGREYFVGVDTHRRYRLYTAFGRQAPRVYKQSVCYADAEAAQEALDGYAAECGWRERAYVPPSQPSPPIKHTHVYRDEQGLDYFVQRAGENQYGGRIADKYRLVYSLNGGKNLPYSTILYDTAEEAQKMLDEWAMINGWKEGKRQ